MKKAFQFHSPLHCLWSGGKYFVSDASSSWMVGLSFSFCFQLRKSRLSLDSKWKQCYFHRIIALYSSDHVRELPILTKLTWTALLCLTSSEVTVQLRFLVLFIIGRGMSTLTGRTTITFTLWWWKPTRQLYLTFFLLCSSLCFLIISIMACLPSPASGNVYLLSIKSVSTTYCIFLVFTWLFRNFRAGSSGNQIFFM